MATAPQPPVPTPAPARSSPRPLWVVLAWSAGVAAGTATLVAFLVVTFYTPSNAVSIGDKVSVVSAVFTFIGVALAIVVFRADHNRRRKQATIEHFDKTSHDLREQVVKLLGDAGSPPLTAQQAASLSADKESAKHMGHLLAALERRALGVNVGVFDFDVLYKLSATFLKQTYEGAYEYMALHRQEAIARGERSRYYEQFELLVRNIRKRDNEHHRPLPS